MREGYIDGPRMLASGEVICITGGHACFLGIEADGALPLSRTLSLGFGAQGSHNSFYDGTSSWSHNEAVSLATDLQASDRERSDLGQER